jgi:nitrogen fixation/metabolism regulation signal transduction histidine kinase
VVPVLVSLSAAEGLVEVPALVSARPVDYGERRVWIVGGLLLNEARARSLAQLTGARVELHAKGVRIASAGSAAPPTLERTLRLGDVATATLSFSQADLVATRAEVLRAFLGFAGVGLLLSVLLGFVISRRITRPVEALTDAAQRIAGGAPGVTVDASRASGELKQLIETFNRMTGDLKDATDKLLASERIAAWQEVARRLAHEIKNPLTPIRMSLETLLAASQRGPLDERFTRLFAESARAVLEEVDRLKRIVDEFSQFARLPRPTLAPLDLAELVAPVMALYGPHDGLRFETALAGRSGAITVRVRAEGDRALLEVQDEGPGIPPQLRERLFEPYVTSKEQGTGLGLAIALRIAREHGGSLELVPREGPGALFRLALPKASLR